MGSRNARPTPRRGRRASRSARCSKAALPCRTLRTPAASTRRRYRVHIAHDCRWRSAAHPRQPLSIRTPVRRRRRRARVSTARAQRSTRRFRRLRRGCAACESFPLLTTEQSRLDGCLAQGARFAIVRIDVRSTGPNKRRCDAQETSPRRVPLPGRTPRRAEAGRMSGARERFDVQPEWVHVKYAEAGDFRDVYGFVSGDGVVNLEGVRWAPRRRPSKTLLVYMHPASTLQLLPMPRAMAEHGAHVPRAGGRHRRDGTPLIMEKVILDLGAYVRHAKEAWGYEKVVLVGWSGGGSLALFYQSQAEHPTIAETPAGDPVDVKGAKLIPGDAVIAQAAHISRAVMLADWIDPSVRDGDDPDRREPELDLYDPRNPNQPPYSRDFIDHFRAAQLARIRRRTAWVKETLDRFRKHGGKEMERGFVTHRTLAEPRFLDGAIEPNDRRVGWCYLGHPETVNSGPIGLARFSSLRAWLSQWSIDDSNAHGERCAARISVPVLAVENTADDAVPQPHTGRIYKATGSADKTMKAIKGATHYYARQPELLQTAVDTCLDWLAARNLLDA